MYCLAQILGMPFVLRSGPYGQEMPLTLLLPTPHSEIWIEELILWVGDLLELASLPWTY